MVLCSPYMWGIIAGSDCTVGSSYPLWWADYNGNPGWPPFSPFGGWSSPAIHQYDDSGSTCGVSFDQNYY
jgi:GH25 family lysozyme M1 (1,4-beta-N-acetylmuramidase)